MTPLPIFWKQRRDLACWMVRMAVKVDGCPGRKYTISEVTPKPLKLPESWDPNSIRFRSV